MSSDSAEKKLRVCMENLEASLTQLEKLVSGCVLLSARVFIMPDIIKGEEHEAITTIDVEKKIGNEALELALQHYKRLFIHHQSEKISTKAAVRLPGIVCLQVSEQQRITLQKSVDDINQLKAKLATIVTFDSGVTREQRFEFVHRQLHGLLTLNAYRTIPLLRLPDTVRFGWANKHIIKTVTASDILNRIDKSLASDRTNAGFSKDAWHRQLNDERTLIEALPTTSVLKIRRPVKVQPIARIWYHDTQKQSQLACSSPVLVLCDEHQQIPEIGELANYDANNITHRYKPAANLYHPLIPRMHLYQCE
ncbi:MAG: DNA replication terminus site-binding protein [Candidatus Erwinia impunctatus]|nr:DNA replication terminus site-binding protein [Culicoides impunctatus]